MCLCGRKHQTLSRHADCEKMSQQWNITCGTWSVFGSTEPCHPYVPVHTSLTYYYLYIFSVHVSSEARALQAATPETHSYHHSTCQIILVACLSENNQFVFTYLCRDDQNKSYTCSRATAINRIQWRQMEYRTAETRLRKMVVMFQLQGCSSAEVLLSGINYKMSWELSLWSRFEEVFYLANHMIQYAKLFYSGFTFPLFLRLCSVDTTWPSQERTLLLPSWSLSISCFIN